MLTLWAFPEAFSNNENYSVLLSAHFGIEIKKKTEDLF
jgi:hypothetical protein